MVEDVEAGSAVNVEEAVAREIICSGVASIGSWIIEIFAHPLVGSYSISLVL